MSAENTYLTHKQVCNLWGNLKKPTKIDNYIIIVHVFKFDVILLVENILPIIKEITISQTILHSQRFDYFEENNKRTKFENQK
jgi:hypothetical protein